MSLNSTNLKDRGVNNMRMKLMLTSISIIFCISCASVAQGEKSTSSLESLYGVSLVETGVRFKVRSNGCTKPEDFIFDIKTLENEATLSILRTRGDHCRRMPKVIELTKTLDYSRIGPNLPIRLVNTFKVNGE